MPPWLLEPLGESEVISVPELFLRIGLAFALGCLVALIYRGTHRTDPVAPTFPRTLVLLSILIAMVTQVIGDNIARAFSLVGALSIVRFRTVVQDTQDTAFVIFAVIIGMAAGADHWGVAIVGLIIVGTAIFLLRPRKKSNVWSQEPSELIVRVGIGNKPETVLQEPFERYLKQFETGSVGTAKQGASLEVTYRVRFQDGVDPLEFVGTLNRLDGIQNVELRRLRD